MRITDTMRESEDATALLLKTLQEVASKANLLGLAGQRVRTIEHDRDVFRATTEIAVLHEKATSMLYAAKVYSYAVSALELALEVTGDADFQTALDELRKTT